MFFLSSFSLSIEIKFIFPLPKKSDIFGFRYYLFLYSHFWSINNISKLQ